MLSDPPFIFLSLLGIIQSPLSPRLPEAQPVQSSEQRPDGLSLKTQSDQSFLDAIDG